MPYKNYNQKMAEYMLRRYHRRREEALKLLGGKCSVCGTTESLEIDHIDADEKEVALNKMWAISKERFLKELAKCQLLCKEHHLEKSKAEGSLNKSWITKPRLVHGSISTFKKHRCRCVKCVEAYKKIHPNSKVRPNTSGA